MKWHNFSLLVIPVLLLAVQAQGQMIGKRDYDAAIALQAGGNLVLPLPFGSPEVKVQPIGGLKMTFPFNRKWFIGTEVNYQRLQLQSRYSPNRTDAGMTGEQASGKKRQVKVKGQQIEMPVYVKYMLNCNKASVLLGVYGSYAFQTDIPGVTSGPDPVWNGGVTVGYEHQIVKRLQIMCRVSGGLRELMKPEYTAGKRLFPLQASLTLSYDVLRIGGCGCD